MLQTEMDSQFDQKLKFLLKNIHGVIFLIDNDGIFRMSEGIGLSKLGLKPGEVVGLSVFEFYKDFPEITEAVRYAMEGEKIVKFIKIGNSCFDVIFSPYKETDETIKGVIGLATDITEIELSKQKLAESEEKFKLIIDLAPDGFFQGNKDGKIIYANEKGAEITGYSQKELTGKNISELFHDESLEQFPLRYDLLEKGKAVISERKLKKADGESIFVQSNSKKMPDGTYVAFLRDVSLTKKMENAIQRAFRLESLGFLAGGIAHNFNNLMTGIFGYITLAEKKTKEDFTKDTLQYILTLMDRVRKLTGQLITFSKGGHPLKEKTHIEQLVIDLCSFCLGGSEIIFINNINTKTYGNIDKSQISQAVENIVINSIQAMPSGGSLTVNSEICHFKEDNKHTLKEGYYIKISFTDTGGGIGPECIGKIFEPFYTTKKTAYGMGLSIPILLSKNMVVLLNALP